MNEKRQYYVDSLFRDLSLRDGVYVIRDRSIKIDGVNPIVSCDLSLRVIEVRCAVMNKDSAK